MDVLLTSDAMSPMMEGPDSEPEKQATPREGKPDADEGETAFA